MKKIFIVITVIFVLFISCNENNKKQEDSNVHLLIKETPDCILKTPYHISKQNDSILLILDRFNLMKLNTLTGDLSKIEMPSIREDLYSMVSEFKDTNQVTLSYEEFLELGVEQDIHLISIDNNSNKLLLIFSLFVQDSINSYSLKPVTFYKSNEQINILYSNDSLNKYSNKTPLGNFTSYLSDSLILTSTINYFNQDMLPQYVPSLLVYSKTDNNKFYLSNDIKFPFTEKDNILLPDEEHQDYPYMSKFKFFYYNNLLFISPGTSIYVLKDNKNVERVIKTENKIVAFSIKNDTASIIEKDENKNYSWHYYNINTNQEIKDSPKLPVKNDIFACDFIDDTLYLIYLKNEKFYLLTILK